MLMFSCTVSLAFSKLQPHLATDRCLLGKITYIIKTSSSQNFITVNIKNCSK